MFERYQLFNYSMPSTTAERRRYLTIIYIVNFPRRQIIVLRIELLDRFSPQLVSVYTYTLLLLLLCCTNEWSIFQNLKYISMAAPRETG